MAKADSWLGEDGLILVQGWARDGLTDEQIAGKMGIGTRTLYEWKKKYPQFSQAIKSGKEVVDYAVESALLKRALRGDVAACCFWLKNRRPDKWKDRMEDIVAKQKMHESVQIVDDIGREAACRSG